jgi:cobalamin biosynthesis protein CobT
VTSLISQQDGEILDNVSNTLKSYIKNINFKEFTTPPALPLLMVGDDDNNDNSNDNSGINEDTDNNDGNNSNDNNGYNNDNNVDNNNDKDDNDDKNDNDINPIIHDPVLLTSDPVSGVLAPQTGIITLIQNRANQIEEDHVSAQHMCTYMYTNIARSICIRIFIDIFKFICKHYR